MAYKAGTVQIDIAANTAKLVKGMTKAENTVKRSVSNIKKTILTIATAYASISTINAFRGMVKDAIDAADATGKLAETLGLTTEGLSRLQYAAGYADVSVQKLNAGLAAMVRRTTNYLRSGGGAAAKALQELGISTEFAAKNFTSTEATFKIIAERLAKMPDGFRKTAIAQDIFSKSAADVVRLANMGATEIAKLGKEADQYGASVPTWAAKMSAAINDSFTKFQNKASGIKRSFTYGLLPAAKTALETIDKWLLKAFGNGAEAAYNMGKSAGDAFISVIKSVGFLKDSITGIKLVLKSIEIGFLYLVKGIATAFNYANKAANSLIGTYNSLPEWMRGDKIEPIQLRDIGTVDKKIANTKKEFKDLTDSIEDGRKAAEKFVKEFNDGLQKNINTINSQNYEMPKAPSTHDTDSPDSPDSPEKQKKAVDSAKKTAKAIYEEFNGLNRQLTNNFESFFDYMGDSFLNFGKLAQNVLHTIFMEIVRTRIIAGFTDNIISKFGTSTSGSNNELNINKKFASGGIVSSPTIFPMATGVGLMGEAGPEAIMPVTRIGGDLGVKSTPSNVIINVSNETGVPVDMKTISETMNDGTRIINVVMEHAQTNPEFRSVMGIK